jgi:hypothetical protein
MASYHLFVMDVDCKLFCSPLLYFDMLSIILLTNYIDNSGWQVITDNLQAVNEVKQRFQQPIVGYFL